MAHVAYRQLIIIIHHYFFGYFFSDSCLKGAVHSSVNKTSRCSLFGRRTVQTYNGLWRLTFLTNVCLFSRLVRLPASQLVSITANTADCWASVQHFSLMSSTSQPQFLFPLSSHQCTVYKPTCHKASPALYFWSNIDIRLSILGHKT